MAHKAAKPARGNGTGSGYVITWAARDNRISTPNISEVQASYLASRFGLDGTRARLTAELAWGCR